LMFKKPKDTLEGSALNKDTINQNYNTNLINI
jgi:hypothetical protein